MGSCVVAMLGHELRQPRTLIIDYLGDHQREKIYCQLTSILSLQQMKLADFVLPGMQLEV